MLTTEQLAVLNRNSINYKNIEKESREVELSKKEVESWELTSVKWIWPATIKTLSENWIKNIEQLLNTPEDEIKDIITNPLSLKGVLNYIHNSKQNES